MTKVHVVAASARTPVGLTLEASAAAVRARISRVSLHPWIVDRHAEPVRCARDALISVERVGWPRMAALSAAPLRALVASLLAGGRRWPGQVDVWLALPEERPGFDADDTRALCTALTKITSTEPREAHALAALSWQLAGRGHAGALGGVASACRRLATTAPAVCIVAGVDSYLTPQTLGWLDACDQLGGRSGFHPGEAAGFLALANSAALAAYGWRSLAEVHAAGTAQETRVIKTDAVNRGDGLTAAVREATAALQEPADSVYCDLNGERYRTEEWGFVALRAPTCCRDATVYEAPASSWGDVGAASGALLVGLAVESWRRGRAAGPRALVWASSQAGLRAAVSLEQPTD